MVLRYFNNNLQSFQTKKSIKIFYFNYYYRHYKNIKCYNFSRKLQKKANLQFSKVLE